MTQDEIIEMAILAGLEQDGDMWFSNLYKTDMDVHISHLEAFAKLVAAKEREACALICIDEVWASTVQGTAVEAFNYASRECSNRIRARGEA
jgi:hypothetical protein